MVTPTAAILLSTSYFRWRSGFCLITVRRCVVGCSSRSSGERIEKSAFHRIPAVIINTKASRHCQHLLEGKTRQTLIGHRLDLVHDKNSMNALQATSAIVTRIHH